VRTIVMMIIFFVVSAMAGILFGPIALMAIIVVAMAGVIMASRARRGVLLSLALIGLGCASVSAWLWRVSFQRANADLPALSWTHLWIPLAIVASVAIVLFFYLYAIQLRKRRG